MDKTSDLNPQVGAPGDSPGAGRTVTPSGDRQIDQIRTDIERTRLKTIQTINELERRLSPARLMAGIRERTRQATLGRSNAMSKETSEMSRRWGTALFGAIKSNPIPMMMVGGGLAWLIANGMRSEEENPEVNETFIERRKTVGTDVTGTYGMGFIDRRRPDESASRGLRGKAGEMGGSVSKKSEEMRAKASQAGRQARQKAQQMGSTAAEYSRRAQDSFIRSVESNPLAMAGVAMFAGAAIGLMVPETSYEEEAMGPQRDEMLERVRSAGRQKVEQVEAVMFKAKESAKEEAHRQGLLSKESSEKAEQSVKEAGSEIGTKVKETKSQVHEKSSSSGKEPGSRAGAWEKEEPQPWDPHKDKGQ